MADLWVVRRFELGDSKLSLAIYWTLPPKRTPFQTRIDRWSNLWKVPRRRRISHTYPMWLWGHSLFKISSPGPVLYGTKWLLWRPHNWDPTFYPKCRINIGLIKRGSTIDHWRSRCRGRISWPTPYTYIHTYIHTYITRNPRRPCATSSMYYNSHLKRHSSLSVNRTLYVAVWQRGSSFLYNLYTWWWSVEPKRVVFE
jgi:hypothetical protein